jgi:hypothetical protein
MTPKHTPGPWWVQRFKEGTLAVYGPYSKTKDILDFGTRNYPATITDADLSLILAAPDLLAALRALVEFADNGTPIQPGAAVVDDARAVIAKALGESK